MDDRQIVEGLRGGDEAALKALMGRYGALLRYVVSPILEEEREIEECLSDIYLRIWDRIGTFTFEKGSLSAWLTVLARDTALNRARGRRDREQSLEAGEEPTCESAEETVLRREQLRTLLRVVGELKEKEQLLFYRKYYYCQSTAQIAAELGLSERAVEGRLYRLREKLRGKLGGEL